MYGCEVIGVENLSTLYENAGQLSLAKENASIVGAKSTAVS